MIDSNRFLGGMRKLRPRKSVLLEVVWLMNSNLWIHRQAIASCCISSWNPEHYLSWVISQDTCCLKAHGFSVSSCLWHSRCWAFRDTSTSLLINSVCYSRGWREASWRVVCGVWCACVLQGVLWGWRLVPVMLSCFSLVWKQKHFVNG